jgi:hypothetical protein
MKVRELIVLLEKANPEAEIVAYERTIDPELGVENSSVDLMGIHSVYEGDNDTFYLVVDENA